MHTDLEKLLTRRLRAAADDSGEAPYDWAEFQRRRHRSTINRILERHRPAAIAASVLAAVLVAGLPLLPFRHQHEQSLAPRHIAPDTRVSDRIAQALDSRSEAKPEFTRDRLVQARTRAIEGWLADLPEGHVIVRVGTHAAVTSLQDQIAALDDLMSAERLAGAQPSRLDALQSQRAQLVSSLAQLRYAEMLASATP